MARPYERIIERGANARGYWRELWGRRGLIGNMAWRDIRVRYKQTYLGFAWAVIQPFVSIIVFTLVFGKLAGLDSVRGVPYPVMVFAGLIPWQLFSSATGGVALSMVGSANLIQRVYFPRMAIPMKAVLVSAFNALISVLLLFVLMAIYGHVPSWHVIFLPIFLFMAGFVSLALGLWVAVLNVRYRDFRYLVPYLLQMGMYLSPVGFKSNVVPRELEFIYHLNPLVGIIDGCRWSLLGGHSPVNWSSMALSMGAMVCFFAFGMWLFRRHEGTFADRI